MSHDNVVALTFILGGFLEAVCGWLTTKALYNLSDEVLYGVFSCVVGATVFVVVLLLLWQFGYLHPLAVVLLAAVSGWLGNKASASLKLWSKLRPGRNYVNTKEDRAAELSSCTFGTLYAVIGYVTLLPALEDYGLPGIIIALAVDLLVPTIVITFIFVSGVVLQLRKIVRSREDRDGHSSRGC